MCTSQSSPSCSGQPKPLIIDTDPGCDDVLAIALALASPEVSIKALTLVFGNTLLDPHIRSNLLRFLAVLRRHVHSLKARAPRSAEEEDADAHWRNFEHSMLLARSSDPSARAADGIPVALGANKPLASQRFTATYFHGLTLVHHLLPADPFPEPDVRADPEAIWPFDLAHPALFDADRQDNGGDGARDGESAPMPAHKLMLKVLREHPPGTVTIAALGPLTNLAMAFQEDPETFARVGRISSMGGALDVPGNTTPVAEFNFYADPTAAHTLLNSALARDHALPIEVIPLDTTTRHTVPYARLCSDEAQARWTRGDQEEESVGATRSEAGLEGVVRAVQSVSRYEWKDFMRAILTRPRALTNSWALSASDAEEEDTSRDAFDAHDPLAIAHAIFAPLHSREGIGGSLSTAAQNNEGGSKFGFTPSRHLASRGNSDSLHDPGSDAVRVPTAQAVDGWSSTWRHFTIERTEGANGAVPLTRGMCVVDRRRSARAAAATRERARTKLLATKGTIAGVLPDSLLVGAGVNRAMEGNEEGNGEHLAPPFPSSLTATSGPSATGTPTSASSASHPSAAVSDATAAPTPVVEQGAWVVDGTPGPAWFERMFCERLGF